MDTKFKKIFDKEIKAVKLLAKYYSDKEYDNALAIEKNRETMQVGDARLTAKLLDKEVLVEYFTEDETNYPVQYYFEYDGVMVFSVHSKEGE